MIEFWSWITEELVEYDKPETLLQNEDGHFSKLCRNYGDHANQL